MGNSIFPSLPGLAWNVSKTPEFATAVKRAASLRELRASLTAYPLYTFSLTYDLLRSASAYQELQNLLGFFLQRHGSFDSFLYTDPEDSIATDMDFGSGDGVQTTFQLTRSFGGFVEPCENINAVTGIKLAGSAIGISFAVGSTGIVTFASAPSTGLLTWTGSFYYRCRFLNDTTEFNQFARQLFEARKVEFVGAPGNKL